MTQIFLPAHLAWTFARLPDVLATQQITPAAVVHVGAHHGEEVDLYRRCGFTDITLVEPDPRSVAVLRGRFGGQPDVSIYPVAATPVEGTGTADLHLAARTVWSGLDPHPTATGYTVQVPTAGIRALTGYAAVLVLDTQGSELELLAAVDLTGRDLVIVETTRRRGDGAAFYDDAVVAMAARRWRVVEEWVHDSSGYTDTVFVPERHR